MAIYVKPRPKEAGMQGLAQHVKCNHDLEMFKAKQSRSEVNGKEKIKQNLPVNERVLQFNLQFDDIDYTETDPSRGNIISPNTSGKQISTNDEYQKGFSMAHNI